MINKDDREANWYIFLKDYSDTLKGSYMLLYTEIAKSYEENGIVMLLSKWKALERQRKIDEILDNGKEI